MKRVLFISYVFPPMVAGGAPRVSQFVKYLPRFGWLPTVLTVPISRRSAVDAIALDELPKEVEIVRAYCPLDGAAARGQANPRSGFAGWRRALARAVMRWVCIPDRQILWYPWAMRAGSDLLRRHRYDAILATHGPATNLLIGERLARQSGVPLVLDFRDLWVGNPGLLSASRLHRSIGVRLERRIVRQAAKIVAVSQPMAEHLAARHDLVREDVVVVSNGFDPADLPYVRSAPRGSDARFCLCYAGSVYGQHDFGPFFEALRDLAADGILSEANFRAVFVGNLADQEPARWGVADLVEIRRPVAHRKVFDALAAADALLMMEAPGYWAKYSYAVKLFDYLLTGKPILALIESGGNSARLLEAVGVGWIASPTDRGEIRAAIASLIERRHLPPIEVDLTAPPLCDFDRRYLTRRLAGFLDAAATRPGYDDGMLDSRPVRPWGGSRGYASPRHTSLR